ncbi:hypothetical protein KR032_006885 [Drosophila birchii]|nr:hypothetical protein KR032_006885 [Drosophila birchii]
MGDRKIYCGGCQNLELPRQLLKNSARMATNGDAVTQGPHGRKKNEEKCPKLESSASSNRPREGFLLGPWVAEQERLCRDSETTANSKRQHGLFAEHLLLSMLCTEELDLPEKMEHAELDPAAAISADQRHGENVPTTDQIAAGLPDGGQQSLEHYGDQNRDGCC